MTGSQRELGEFAAPDSDGNPDTIHIDPEERPPTKQLPDVVPGGTPRQSPTTPPPKCLVFSISGPFAHFRRVETSQTRLSYRIPPRTTIAGLLAGILGYDRDSYYQAFSRDHAAIAVEISDPLRTITMPISHRTVDDGSTTTIGDDTLSFKLVESAGDRQRVAHEMLRNPQYRVFVWLSNTDAYTQLKQHLKDGTSVYTPALGLSECLATIDYHGEYTVTPIDDNQTSVDSIVPSDAGDVYQPDAPVIAERAPAEMERVRTPLPSRRTTKFLTYHFREDANPLQVTSPDSAQVNGKTVIFS